MESNDFKRHIAVTGGAGFIGSNLLLLLVPRYPDDFFVNIDALTYAGNLSNLATIEGADNYRFERLDITEPEAVRECFRRYKFDGVIHLAAESHVDRSILGPEAFVRTNVLGTANLLEAARAQEHSVRFVHVSTDEVFGSLEQVGKFTAESPYRPSSPYAASKAAADHLVRAYHRTYGMETIITNCSNNFGPYQFPEKLIPLVIRNAVAGKPIPVYGNGLQRRDWLFVRDHCEALDRAFRRGRSGATYLAGADTDITNIDLIRRLCRALDARLGGTPREQLITHVTDRPGHDYRYALDVSSLREELEWRPQCTFDEALEATIDWYLTHEDWLAACDSGVYREYYEQNYANR
ncbi:dTDP-glucose 4,6-dehydratase [candidate division GN15 bacterium]|nr:dTDP-glucose 4,6-dehydratase [candidate division GN15 bacterium]